MNQISISKIAVWIEGSYKAYLSYLQQGNERFKYSGDTSADWSSGSLIRTSKVAGDCPKYSAAVARGLCHKKEFTLNEMAKMEDGTRAAEVVAEALAWACSANSLMTSVVTEKRIIRTDIGVAGTIDDLITIKGLDDTEYNIPIEIKKTSADKYFRSQPRGIFFSHFVQVIGEMLLVDSKVGFVLTLYSHDSDPIIKLWTVVHNNGGWNLLDGDVYSSGDKNWPTLNNGAIFLGEDDYFDIVRRHKYYMEVDDPVNEAPPYRFGESYKCGKIVDAEYYAENGKYKGAKKNSTGEIRVNCPLFNICYKKELEQRGFDASKFQNIYPLDK